MNRLPDAEVLLTPREVADLFGVDPKTVTRWAKAGDRKSTRLNSSHRCISYAVFCLKKKNSSSRAT